jgi:hypothetical protein
MHDRLIWMYWEGPKPLWIHRCQQTVFWHCDDVRLLGPEDDELQPLFREVDLSKLCMAHKAELQLPAASVATEHRHGADPDQRHADGGGQMLSLFHRRNTPNVGDLNAAPSLYFPLRCREHDLADWRGARTGSGHTGRRRAPA